jgi:hypothetical protein
MSYTNGLDNPELYFQAVLYGGNSSTQSITLGGDEDMQPDLVWIKARSDAGEHTVYDSVRGATKRLDSADTGAEDTVTNGVTAFDSDGFSLGAGGNENSATTIVAWCWKESATAGFDIVAYDGVGVGTAQNVNHSLSAVPELYVVKSRESVGGWHMYHHKMSAAPETDYIDIDSTAAVADYTFWGDTAPTSSVFTVDDGNDVNESGEGFLCYLWRSVQGFSKFGSYDGNGNADGTFVYTGFRPAMVILKSTTSTNGWEMRDNKRPGYNLSSGTLAPSSSDAETTGEGIDIFSNGFKCRASGNGQNGSGNTYIYMAFAEAPFVNSNGVPCNAR